MPLRTNRGSSISAPREVAPKENKATSAATPSRRNSAPAVLQSLQSRSPRPAAESRAPVGRLNAFNQKFGQTVLPQRQQATAGSQLHQPSDSSRPVTLGNVMGHELDTNHRPTPLVQDNKAGGIWKKPGSQNGMTGKFNFAADEKTTYLSARKDKGSDIRIWRIHWMGLQHMLAKLFFKMEGSMHGTTIPLTSDRRQIYRIKRHSRPIGSRLNT